MKSGLVRTESAYKRHILGLHEFFTSVSTSIIIGNTRSIKSKTYKPDGHRKTACNGKRRSTETEIGERQGVGERPGRTEGDQYGDTRGRGVHIRA